MVPRNSVEVEIVLPHLTMSIRIKVDPTVEFSRRGTFPPVADMVGADRSG
jgi:hypothetical protein